jgi:pimeloyl-ACP methyl ester carboxylesterase
VNGDRIGYRRFGTGTPIVLATRMRGTLDTWDPLFLDGLAETLRVITVDYPGIGYSSGSFPGDIGKAADFVDTFANAIGIPQFIMAGWSWGGQVAQAFLLEHPERATHAVLIGTNPPGKVDIPIQPVFLERAFKPVNDLADDEVLFFEPKSEASRRAAKASRERIYARPDMVAKIPSRMEEIQAYIAAAQGFGEDKPGRRDKLIATRTPILVICGDHDTSTAGQNWFPLMGKLRNAHLVMYPKSGHGPQHQYPELTVHHINAFLRHAVS